MGAAAIPIVLGVVGMGVQMYGQNQTADANNEYYQYLAKENEKEAVETGKTASLQKSLMYDTASRQSEIVKNDLLNTVASQKTGMVANNISLSSKTAEDIIRSNANVEAKDEAAIRYNADISAWDISRSSVSQQNKLYSQAEAYRKAGKAARSAGDINMFSTLLGGTAKLFA